jgi:hypothetical protein
MADRRLIAQSITNSGQVAQLVRQCGPWAATFFTWALTFIDDDSRFEGDPETLRHRILGRYLDLVSPELVAEIVALMNDIDLALWYEVIGSPGERYLYFPRFTTHQTLREDRYGPSRLPAPPSWTPEEGHPYTKNAQRISARKPGSPEIEDLRRTKPQRDLRRTVRVPKRRRTPDDVFVYFIADDAGGPVKIGQSKAPIERLTALQTSYPYRLRLLAQASGAQLQEVQLHARFAHLRLLGEWFRPDPELLSFITTLSGDPDAPAASPPGDQQVTTAQPLGHAAGTEDAPRPASPRPVSQDSSRLATAEPSLSGGTNELRSGTRGRLRSLASVVPVVTRDTMIGAHVRDLTDLSTDGSWPKERPAPGMFADGRVRDRFGTIHESSAAFQDWARREAELLTDAELRVAKEKSDQETAAAAAAAQDDEPGIEASS